jgi:hypothetical protein
MTGHALPDLPPKHAAVLAETVDMTFTHPDSHKKCVLKRTQLPLVPAFAMTAHKAQGKTMEVVVVDLESTRGTESPYVMLSRAKSLDGVFILRPFRQKVIQCRPKEDVRNEFKRLDILCYQTKMKYGTPAESKLAQEYLVNTFSLAALPEDGELVDFTSGNARTLARLQSSSARLISAGATPTSGTRSTRSTRRSTRSPPRRAHNRPPQTSTPMDVDAAALRYQKRSCPSEGPDTQEHLTKRKRK